jgi:hypothetical protein
MVGSVVIVGYYLKTGSFSLVRHKMFRRFRATRSTITTEETKFNTYNNKGCNYESYNRFHLSSTTLYNDKEYNLEGNQYGLFESIQTNTRNSAGWRGWGYLQETG